MGAGVAAGGVTFVAAVAVAGELGMFTIDATATAEAGSVVFAEAGAMTGVATGALAIATAGLAVVIFAVVASIYFLTMDDTCFNQASTYGVLPTFKCGPTLLCSPFPESKCSSFFFFFFFYAKFLHRQELRYSS